MGCSFETAKQSSGITETFDTLCHVPIITPTSSRTRYVYVKGETKPFLEGNNNKCKTNNNNSICNHYNSKQDKTNDDCQQLQHQDQPQQQKPAKAKKTTTNTTTTTTKSHTSATASNIFNCNNCSSNDTSNIRDDFKRKSNFYSLEAKEHINKDSCSLSAATQRPYQQAEREEEALQESCLNCYPLACHKRICCRQQNLTADDEIVTHTRHSLDFSCNYFNTNSDNSGTDCSKRPYPLAQVSSSYFCQKHRNTLRHESHSETQEHLDSAEETASIGSEPRTRVCAPNGPCLESALSQARKALTSNTVDLKSGLIQLVGNCAAMMESLMRTKPCRKLYCNVNNQEQTNKNNNNNNKSEPYRGYCQRKHTSKPDFIPYTSTYSSCTLHDAISSKHRHQHHHLHHQQPRRNNTKSSNCNNTSNMNNSCRNCQAASATASTTSASASSSASASQTQTTAFNYIGHNYYNFLRNSINFYTAYTASVILVLCYLTTTTSAAIPKSDGTSLDKHPM